MASVEALRTSAPVYDVQVEGNENFFANGILTHNCGIIDDIFKNEEEAFSETVRRKRIDWYFSTWFDRREPSAAEILVNTRWHMNDLIGVLLEEERTNPRGWHIVHFDALKEEPRIQIPETCTLEPDYRKPGDALCPERYDAEELKQIKATQKRFFQTKWQGRPTLVEGEVWKRAWFKDKVVSRDSLWLESDGVDYTPEKTRITRVGMDWDLAYTESEKNSASAFVTSGVDERGNVYILDLGFRWLEFPELVTWMASFHLPHYVERKATGKSAVQVLKRSNIHAEEVEVNGPDKVSRAILATPSAESGRVYLVSDVAERLLDDPRQGILNFPAGNGDDLNDAFVQALNRLFGVAQAAWRDPAGKVNILEHYQSPKRRSVYDD